MDTIVLLTFIFVGFITVFSFGLLIISFNSYRKSGNKKILFVSLVLLFFFLKTLFLSVLLFTAQIESNSLLLALELFDLLILLFLYIAVLIK